MAGNEIKGEMIRGHVDTFILLSLCNGDKDSNEIKEAIEERSDNKFTVKQGTFYSAMQRLVKQNFIKEYRSSAADGIRRKYYSLTEKGKKSLEKNREEWTKSKELIDNLIDTPQQQPQSEKVVIPEVKDEFDEFKKFAEQNASDYTFFAPDNTDDSYLDRLGSEVLNDLTAELDSIKSEEEHEDAPGVVTESDGATPGYTEFLPPDENEFVTDASDDDIAAERLYADTANDDELSEDKFVYDFELPEHKPEIVENEIESTTEETLVDSDAINDAEIEETDKDEQSENFENSSIKSEENYSVYETEFTDAEDKTAEPEEIAAEQNAQQSVVESEQVEEPVKKDERDKDDSLYIEDGAPTNRREYKTILGKLFPRNDEPENKPTNEVQNENRQIDFEEYSTSKNVNNDKVEYDEYEENANDEEADETTVGVAAQNSAPRIYQTEKITGENVSRQNDYDFSDLYKMAKVEGFKVRTSASTNKFNGNGIFINKLNFHASLLFYGIFFIEMLVLNFALAGALGWPLGAKASIVGIPALLPLVLFVIYLVSPKRKIREVTQFKDAITVFLIITFQLMIVDLCVALFLEVDFNNIKDVLAFIVIPFVIMFNIPLFPIVKYSLLGSGNYFDVKAD